MSYINNFAKSGAWDYRNIIIPAAAGIPLAVEGAILAKNIYQKPHVIKEKWIAAKNQLIQSFTIQSGESQKEGLLRIAKNAFILLSCLSLMAAAAYGSVILLPSALAITTAISAIFLIGKLFLNAKEYKKQMVEAFTQKLGEDPDLAKQRIRKNILKAVAIAAIAITAIAIGALVLAPMLTHGFSWSVSLPLQTKGVVFAEYATVGALNGAIACYKWRKGDRMGALFHLFAGALSFVFPAYYWNRDMRLHHSFYGLLMMAAPSRPLQFLGSIITLDSSLYMLAPLRGYPTFTSTGLPCIEKYDLINSVVDNYPLFAGTYAGALMAENMNDQWKENRS